MNLAAANEPWLGQVPGDWKRSRIRDEAILSPGFSLDLPSPDEPCAVVPRDSLSTDGAIDFSSQQPFERPEVLFAKITPCMENGKGALLSEMPTRYAFGSTGFHVLRPMRGVAGRFLDHVTFNPTFRAFAAENMTGAAGQKRVSSRFLKDTRLFLPRCQHNRGSRRSWMPVARRLTRRSPPNAANSKPSTRSAKARFPAW
jgi:type I restriction enzyme S subunit